MTAAHFAANSGRGYRRVAGQCQCLGRDGSPAGSCEPRKNARSSGLSKRPEPLPRTHTRARSLRVPATPSRGRSRHARSNPRPLRALPLLLRTTRASPTPSHPFVETRPWCTRADPRRLRYASRLHAPPPPVPASRALSETGHARAHPARAFASRFPPIIRPRDLSPNPSFTPPRPTRKRLFAFRVGAPQPPRQRDAETLKRFEGMDTGNNPEVARLLEEMREHTEALAKQRKHEDPRLSFSTPEFKDFRAGSPRTSRRTSASPSSGA